MSLSADESYASLAEADTYASDRAWSDWADATDPAKEAALRVASQYLDVAFIWPGQLSSTDQMLGWPRAYAYDRDGRTLSDVPSVVKTATIEAARLALTGPLVGGAEAGKRLPQRVKAATVEVDFGAAATASGLREQQLELVGAILRRLGARGSCDVNVALAKS